VNALDEGVADRLWHRIQAQDRLDALDESAGGPTYRERLRSDRTALTDAVEEARSAAPLPSVSAASRWASSAAAGRRRSPPVEGLLRAGLAVAPARLHPRRPRRRLGALCQSLA
jgi:hypothetical protein